MFEASCLCGGVRLRFTEIRGSRVLCHCRRCQKSTGSAFGANANVPRDGLQIVAGEALLSSYQSSPGKRRRFCSRCGAELFAELSRDPTMVRIRLGTLDTPYAEPHAGHAFVAEKAAWDTICDPVPQHDGRAPDGGR
ncbi:MAG: GFA family protein [Burkholderiaceae bacterium]